MCIFLKEKFMLDGILPPPFGRGRDNDVSLYGREGQHSCDPARPPLSSRTPPRVIPAKAGIHPPSSQRGVTYLAAIMALVMFSMLGAALAQFVATNYRVQSDHLRSELSFFYMQAGLEFVERKLRGVNYDGTILPSIVGTYEIGNGSFAVADLGNETAQVTGTYGNAQVSHSIVVDPTQAGCLTFNSTGANLSRNGWPRMLRGVSVFRKNTTKCNAIQIVLSAFEDNTWVPNTAGHIREILIASVQTYFDNTVPTQGGDAPFDSTYTISDGLSKSIQINYRNADFKNGTHDFSWSIVCGDGSKLEVSVDDVPGY